MAVAVPMQEGYPVQQPQVVQMAPPADGEIVPPGAMPGGRWVTEQYQGVTTLIVCLVFVLLLASCGCAVLLPLRHAYGLPRRKSQVHAIGPVVPGVRMLRPSVRHEWLEL